MTRKFFALLVLAAAMQLGCHGSRPDAAAPVKDAAPAAVAAPSGKAWPKPERFEAELAKLEAADRAPVPKGAIVAIGSSSMRGWHKSIREDLAPLTVVPRGFGGSNMNDALFWTDRLVLAHKPRAVMLYEGDNDIAGGHTPEEFLGKVKEFVAEIHDAAPKTRIYVLAIKPSPSRWKHWPEMQRANAMLKELCESDKRLTFIDVATPMLKADGTPKDDIYLNDRLHMNPQGYALWTEAVRPVLMEKEARHEKKKR